MRVWCRVYLYSRYKNTEPSRKEINVFCSVRIRAEFRVALYIIKGRILLSSGPEENVCIPWRKIMKPLMISAGYSLRLGILYLLKPRGVLATSQLELAPPLLELERTLMFCFFDLVAFPPRTANTLFLGVFIFFFPLDMSHRPTTFFFLKTLIFKIQHHWTTMWSIIYEVLNT